MADYEKIRQLRIAENKLRLKEARVQKMASELLQLKKGSKQNKKSNMQMKKVAENTKEYTPDEEEIQLSEDNDNYIRKTSLNLRPRTKKPVRGTSPTKMKEMSDVSSMPMATLLKMRHSNTKSQAIQERVQTQSRHCASINSEKRLGQPNAQKILAFESHQEKDIEHTFQIKKGQSKAMVAPGSLSAYFRMKAMSKEKEVRNKGKVELLREMWIAHKWERTRGPTMCKDVLEWTFEERRPIILNELGKPIGPDSKTLDRFSRFLGTIARSPTLAPLNNLNWHDVRDKDNIWNYVKDKMEEVQMQRQIDGDQAYSVIMNPDNSKNQRQLGKCKKKGGESKRASVGGVIIPDEFLKPYKDQIVRDTVGEVMKMFKDQLPPERFDNMTRSLGDMSFGLDVTGDPSKDTSDQDQDQGNDHLLE
ncbi:GPI transamidase component PIG-T [Bienertia sinuspersici]